MRAPEAAAPGASIKGKHEYINSSCRGGLGGEIQMSQTRIRRQMEVKMIVLVEKRAYSLTCCVR
jgi:hypothetical protein